MNIFKSPVNLGQTIYDVRNARIGEIKERTVQMISFIPDNVTKYNCDIYVGDGLHIYTNNPDSAYNFGNFYVGSIGEAEYRVDFYKKHNRIISEFPDSSVLYFDSGRFDDWCVYYKDFRNEQNSKAPEDKIYFNTFKNLSTKYSADRIYSDFITIYNKTNDKLSDKVIGLIDTLSNSYEDNIKVLIKKLYTILYAGMIAEENKENTRLGKRIKRLGMHVALIDGKDANYASNYMKGKSYKWIDAECSIRGF